MEKISAENLVLHRSCLKCAHCHTNLRLGGYAFDRDSPNGFFYCTQHFRLPVKSMKAVAPKHPRLMVSNSDNNKEGKKKKKRRWRSKLADEFDSWFSWFEDALFAFSSLY